MWIALARAEVSADGPGGLPFFVTPLRRFTVRMELIEASYDATATLPALLDPQEVADLLGVSRRRVSVLAHEGVIEGVKLGHRTLRYTRRSVLAVIDPHNDHDPAGNRAVEKASDDGARNTV